MYTNVSEKKCGVAHDPRCLMLLQIEYIWLSDCWLDKTSNVKTLRLSDKENNSSIAALVKISDF